MFCFPFRVYYDDTDAGGVVYHTHYLKYMERARTESLFELGYSIHDLAITGTLFVVHRMAVKYHKPAHLGQSLQVSSQVVEFKKTRMLWVQSVECPVDQSAFCQAEIWVACIGSDFKPKVIPADVCSALMALGESK